MQFINLTLLILVLSILVYLWFKFLEVMKLRIELSRLSTLNEEKDLRITVLQQKSDRVDGLSTQNARLQSDLENERKTSQEKLQLLQDAQVKMKTDFENLANRIFEEKGKTFTDQNKEKLEHLLAPFREQMEGFRKRVDDVHVKEAENYAQLREQVKQLMELNIKISEDATNLAEAIKGDTKKQGNWGQLIVERLFEASGLEKGREYDVEVSIQSEEGRAQRPDFLVYLPGNKVIIVDSKVSLTAFERYFNTEDEKEQEKALADHLLSVRKHIDELKTKQYQNLLGNKTLDFVIMCVPVEPAYQLAMQKDKNLVYDLASENVVITGPSTLMITLKLIAQIWRRENENRNAEVIAEKAGKLYDQVALIVESMLDAQRKLTGVRESFDEALKRLKDGKGNLVNKVHEIRKLGAKSSKQIPVEILEKALGDNGDENIEA